MDIFERSWAQAWLDLSLTAPTGLFAALLTAYTEPQRHYHSQQHLAECLRHFEQVRHLAHHPGEVAIALWFHDAVYDVQGKSNERRSADWAVRVLHACRAGQSTQQSVEQLIMATKHDATPLQADAQLLVDIDLCILGATPERFAEYDRQVRAEYSWVPRLIYNAKRKSVLQSFLARPQLYNTPYFSARYEAQAHLNLAAIL